MVEVICSDLNESDWRAVLVRLLAQIYGRRSIRDGGHVPAKFALEGRQWLHPPKVERCFF